MRIEVDGGPQLVRARGQTPVIGGYCELSRVKKYWVWTLQNLPHLSTRILAHTPQLSSCTPAVPGASVDAACNGRNETHRKQAAVQAEEHETTAAPTDTADNTRGSFCSDEGGSDPNIGSGLSSSLGPPSAGRISTHGRSYF